MFLTFIFQGLFKKIVFRSVALITKKLDFVSQTGLFSALYPTLGKKKN